MIERILQPMPRYEKEYSVTTIGEVFGHFRKAFLKPTICSKGYYRYRLSSGNTQVELAKRFNCSQSLISQIKRGIRSI